MRKYSVTISGHATSISLEPEFWEHLKKIALTENKSINELITDIDQRREGNLSSALRIYVLKYITQPLL